MMAFSKTHGFKLPIRWTETVVCGSVTRIVNPDFDLPSISSTTAGNTAKIINKFNCPFNCAGIKRKRVRNEFHGTLVLLTVTTETAVIGSNNLGPGSPHNGESQGSPFFYLLCFSISHKGVLYGHFVTILEKRGVLWCACAMTCAKKSADDVEAIVCGRALCRACNVLRCRHLGRQSRELRSDT